jgi:hypothetical protein
MRADIQKIKLADGREVTITLKSDAFNIFDDAHANLWTFDHSARLIGMFVDGINYRRTLNNQFFEKTRERINGEDYRDVKLTSRQIVEPLMIRGQTILDLSKSQLPEHFLDLSKQILSATISNWDEDTVVFSNIYKPISILPPDQYLSLVVQLTEGCNFNKCIFCNFYKDRPFRIKNEIELKLHIQQIDDFFGKGISLRKSIFLADANAIVTPQQKLVKSIELIRNQFPAIKSFYSFIDVFTGIKKTTKDFAELKSHGLKRVYLGIESGNSELLDFLKKPQIHENIIQLSEDLKQAGINLGVIFLVGVGGEVFYKQHLKDSLDITSKLNLSKGDFVYLSEFYNTNDDYKIAMQNAKIDLPSRVRVREMSNEFKLEMRKIVEKKVLVTAYDIQQFFY